MNKLCYMLCVLYVPTYAMQGFLVSIIATTPVTVPGAYNYFKTEQFHKRLSDDHEKNELIEHDTFRPFVTGVVGGVVPPHNLISACTYGPAYLFTELEKWERHEKKFLENDRERARVIGFIGGLSLYATVPLALRCVRR
jgi:hypothetical protein